MQITVEIPDNFAEHVLAAGKDPARSVLEDALIEAYREERIGGWQLMEMLGIPTRYDLDGFLKERGVWIEYTPEEYAAEKATADQVLAGLQVDRT